MIFLSVKFLLLMFLFLCFPHLERHSPIVAAQPSWLTSQAEEIFSGEFQTGTSNADRRETKGEDEQNGTQIETR